MLSDKQTELLYKLREKAVTVRDYSEMSTDPKLRSFTLDMMRTFDDFLREIDV